MKYPTAKQCANIQRIEYPKNTPTLRRNIPTATKYENLVKLLK